MPTKSINAPLAVATPPADRGTPVTREYSPSTVLTDGSGREWTVTSYGTSAYRVGAMPPFEAMQTDRIETLFGRLVVHTASPAHRHLRHPRPMPGCHNCPTVPCRCGDLSCTDYETHRREWAGSETTWREMAA